MARNTTDSEDLSFSRAIAENIGDASWVLSWVAENFEPGDVFDYDTLARWAEDNEFILESECPEVENESE